MGFPGHYLAKVGIKMITKQIEILSCALKHKKLYTPSYLKKIVRARNRTLYVLDFRFGHKPIGWIGDEQNPVIIYVVKDHWIGYATNKIGNLPYLHPKQPKEYPKPTAEQVTNAVRYLERFLTKYGNSIHKMDSDQFNQFRKIIEGDLV
jgi:hypothetical protein